MGKEPLMSMIQSISGQISNPASIAAVNAPPEVQRPESEVQDRFQKPVTDEYIPEEKQEPSGLYWLSRDEDGQPRICFDDPERAGGTPEKPEEETCTGNTDKVDREIEQLKKKQEELKRQINSETDGVKRRKLVCIL